MSAVVVFFVSALIAGVAVYLSLRWTMRRAEDKRTAEWVTTYESPDRSTKLESLDGVAWHEAPIPHRLHRCTPQTKGWFNYFTQVFRCACGGISEDCRCWIDRNSRHE